MSYLADQSSAFKGSRRVFLNGAAGLHGVNKVWGISRGIARYGASRVVLLGMGRSLGMRYLHATCWSSVTLSAEIGKAVSQSLSLGQFCNVQYAQDYQKGI